MYLYEILVPTLRDENGPKYFSTKYHKLWDEKIKQIAGGLTILKPQSGKWLDKQAGTAVHERVIPVRIAVENSSIMDKIADITQKHYMQKAIFYYLISSEVIIKEYNDVSKV